MSKKDIMKAAPTYKKPVLDVLDEFNQETTASGERSEKKSERISIVVTQEIAQDLNDLLSARLVNNKRSENAIMGKRSKKPSVNLLVIEALSEFFRKPEIRDEVDSYRAKFK